MMLTIKDQRAFLPTKDLTQSLDFYVRLGWDLKFKSGDIALVELAASHLLLQKYCQEDWANNTMVHLVVDDAAAWYERAVRVKIEGGFDMVKIRPPFHESYGATVTHVIDPAGVLLHFAEFDK